MTQNEIELLKIVRADDNPDQAIIMAIDIILSFLTHLESSELEFSVD